MDHSRYTIHSICVFSVGWLTIPNVRSMRYAICEMRYNSTKRIILAAFFNAWAVRMKNSVFPRIYWKPAEWRKKNNVMSSGKICSERDTPKGSSLILWQFFFCALHFATSIAIYALIQLCMVCGVKCMICAILPASWTLLFSYLFLFPIFFFPFCIVYFLDLRTLSMLIALQIT